MRKLLVGIISSSLIIVLLNGISLMKVNLLGDPTYPDPQSTIILADPVDPDPAFAPIDPDPHSSTEF